MRLRKRFMQGSRLTKPGLPVKDTKSGEACSRVSSVLTAGERRVQSFMSRQTARVSMQSRCHRNGQKYGPEDPSYDENYFAERWKFYAATQVDIHKSTFEESWLLSYEDFRRIAEKAKGGAGFDGWTAIELRLLCRLAPFLIEELHHLWCETAAYLERAITDPVLQKMLMHWRVVGIPKKDPLQNRPISVASVLFRTWLTACEPALPCPSEAAGAGRVSCRVARPGFVPAKREAANGA